MASSRSRPVVTFRHPLTVEVFEPRFKLSSSLRFLDVDALSRTARGDVAIGEVDGGCCQHTVYATVRRGMVVGIRVEECPREGRATLSRDQSQLVAQAMKRMQAKRRGGRTLPMPVATFFGNASVALGVALEVLFCFRICFFGVCFTCCQATTTPDALIFCGRVTIDGTKTG